MNEGLPAYQGAPRSRTPNRSCSATVRPPEKKPAALAAGLVYPMAHDAQAFREVIAMAEQVAAPEVKKLLERKLEIAAEVRRLRAEGARVNQELFRLAPENERVSTFIAAW